MNAIQLMPTRGVFVDDISKQWFKVIALSALAIGLVLLGSDVFALEENLVEAEHDKQIVLKFITSLVIFVLSTSIFIFTLRELIRRYKLKSTTKAKQVPSETQNQGQRQREK